MPKCFTFAAHRRVRSELCSLAPPGYSLERIDLLLLLTACRLRLLLIELADCVAVDAQRRCKLAFQVLVKYTIPCTFAICQFLNRAVRLFSGIVYGGDEGARTPDLDSAIVALSQLSYIPGQARS